MIKMSYSKKEDVPEKFIELYSEKDGKFVLNTIDGMKTQADVDNVQKALKAERQLKKDAEAKLTAYDGIESEGLRAQLDELAKLRTTGGTVDDTKIEGIVAERLKLDKAKHERDIEALSGKLAVAETSNKNLVNEKNTSLIETKLREAASGKVTETAIGDVLFRASQFEVSEDGNVLTKDGVGVTPGQEPSVWLEETLKDKTHWQKTSSGAGARGSKGNRQGSPSDGPMSMKEILAEECVFND